MTGIEGYQASFDEEPGYLDWAAFGPLSPGVRSEVHADAELLGSGRSSSIQLVAEHTHEARSLLAELLDSDEEAVTLQPSTSVALTQAVYGLSGGVLLHRGEFASAVVTAARAALGRIDPQWLDSADGYMSADAVSAALTPETTALIVSLVDSRSGCRADLSALRDVIGPDRLLLVDAIQGFGMIEADYAAADVVCGHGCAWLRAGRGTGFARFGPRAIELITPMFSSLSATDAAPFVDGTFPPAHSARAFMLSRPDHLAAARLASAAREVVGAGVAHIEAELADRSADVIYLADRYAVPVVTPREPQRRAGIVTLAPEAADAAPLAAALANFGLVVTARSGLVRIATHVGTDADTLRLLGDALAAFNTIRSSARTW